MKKLQRKVNWLAVWKLTLMLASGSYVIYNFYMLTIYPYIYGKLTSLTLVGALSLLLAIAILYDCIEYAISRFKAIR